MRTFTLSMFLICVSIASASAADINNVIEESFVHVETALNDRAEPMKKIEVLHNLISENATFEVKVDNPALNAAQNSSAIQLDKAGYINSFLMGANYVDNYSADIQTLSIKSNKGSDKATSHILLQESGTMLNPYNISERGKDFISSTQCYSVHGEEAQILSSKCETKISYNEQI